MGLDCTLSWDLFVHARDVLLWEPSAGVLAELGGRPATDNARAIKKAPTG